jgi:SPP1 gp7 family putative phage head morphogenesis protein
VCGFCDIQNKEEPINLFSEEEIDNYIIGVFAGVYSVKNLDLSTYLKIARKLSQGVFTGYTKTLFDVQYGTEDYVMLKALQENVYLFSGAKQYQMLNEMEVIRKELTKGGKVMPFSEFKKYAKETFETYNENYLRAEYNSTIDQARNVSRWQEYVKESNIFPNLRYVTAGDGRVRAEHRLLDGIVRPVNDPFWRTYAPQNDWNCRCILVQEKEDVNTTKLKGKELPEIPDAFKFNPGVEKAIFNKKHPYFNVRPKDKKFAKQNFGMPLP